MKTSKRIAQGQAHCCVWVNHLRIAGPDWCLTGTFIRHPHGFASKLNYALYCWEAGRQGNREGLAAPPAGHLWRAVQTSLAKTAAGGLSACTQLCCADGRAQGGPALLAACTPRAEAPDRGRGPARPALAVHLCQGSSAGPAGVRAALWEAETVLLAKPDSYAHCSKGC